MKKPKKLGRGLDALLGPRPRSTTEAAETADRAPGPATVELAIAALAPGPYQPRRQLSEDGLTELAASICEQGVLQPLVVRPGKGVTDGAAGRRFEIVAGERRWRAARLAGLSTVPVVIRELDDRSALAVALIENLQREDLNPIDQAHALSRLAEEFALTHDQVAKAVGRSRSSVSNLLRLLDLHGEVKDLLANGKIDMGHARALLPLDPQRQVALARKACTGSMSVRQVEEAVRSHMTAAAPRAEKPGIDLQTRWLQRQLAEESGRRIAIRPGAAGGYTLQVGFADLEQLQEALQRVQELLGQLRDTAGPRVRDVKK